MVKKNGASKDLRGQSKPAKQNKKLPEELTLAYSLYDLPTAQHKAGLAGLLLMIKSLKMRKLQPVPEVVKSGTSFAEIRITPESLRTLYSDYYDGQWGETSSRVKWKKGDLLREEEKEIETGEGKTKTERRYIYKTFQPKAAFLAALNGDKEPWIKLYRDMVWSILRSRPTMREVYKARADGEPLSLPDKSWSSLVKSHQAKGKGKLVTESISSALYLGGQDTNAEQVSFQGVPEHNFLLHFWPLATSVFCPFILNIKGETEDAGYVLVIPEPSDLQCFQQDYMDVLGSLSADTQGYRPKSARIDVPAEGGLEYIGAMVRRRAARSITGFSLAAVEVFHLEKKGNNVRMHSLQRIQPSPHTIDQYEALKNTCSNPLFKNIRLANLLADRPWHVGFTSLMTLWPYEFFIHKSGATPEYVPFFGNDVRRAFDLLRKNLQHQGELPMDTKTKEDALALRVHDLVRSYVNRRTEEKCGITYDSFKDKRDEQGNISTPQPYREAREKVCADAFLAIRGRNDRDFVAYFAGTICSVPQYMNKEDFLEVTQALFGDWEKVKTISLLALSAASWSSKNIKKQNNNQ